MRVYEKIVNLTERNSGLEIFFHELKININKQNGDIEKYIDFNISFNLFLFLFLNKVIIFQEFS